MTLAYGRHGLPVRLPDDGVTVIEPVFSPGLPAPARALKNALRAPLRQRPLRDLARRGLKAAIAICDITRPQPRRLVLDALLGELGALRRQDIAILIATGTHRPNTPEELRQMVGPEILQTYRVANHVARDEASLVDAGRTASGVPVFLNREWLEADLRITTGVVEPHFFAGFSGGPKLAAPGLAGIDTVMRLHDAAHIGHPSATWGITHGNPVHDDIREIARLTGVDFAVDVVLNREQDITHVFAGELFAEHRAACEAAKAVAMRPVAAPFDVVATTNSGYPLDQNLYQAVKGMSAAARVVKPGGVIICAAECEDGIPAHGSYADILRARSSPGELLNMICAPGYSEPDQWQVQIQAQIQQKARVLVKAGCLTAEQLAEAHFEAVDDVESAIADALAEAGPGATLCVLPEGPQTIPYIARSRRHTGPPAPRSPHGGDR